MAFDFLLELFEFSLAYVSCRVRSLRRLQKSLAHMAGDAFSNGVEGFLAHDSTNVDRNVSNLPCTCFIAIRELPS